ncbi:MAG: flagellar hook-associated protein FlgK [Intrasporangium sp.]|uniref:flagellar hook-associated protein FlgK n=1 Tax=Intrasporangium sp. TaxID=1925024 RepID=UPI003F7E72B4
MSSFGALNTAYRGLSAAQQALDLAGHNVANVGTDGYTRQRIDQSSMTPPARAGLAATGVQVGQGVSVDRITRLGNALLDATVRTATSSAAYLTQRSAAYERIESTLREPGTDGVSARLQSFWAAWQDVANWPGEAGPANTLLSSARQLVSTLSSGRAALEEQWSDTRSSADAMTASLNDAADQVAALNKSIRSALNVGSPANELIDARARLTETIASLAGGTVREEPDGTVSVYVGGNALVRGDAARHVRLTGPETLTTASSAPTLEWADQPGLVVGLEGGSIAGALSVLAPAGAGTGGAIAEAAARYDAMAESLATAVNAVHRAGQNQSGATGLDFFQFDPTRPAGSLTVVPVDRSGLALGGIGLGPLDGSNADAIAQLAKGASSPDAQWASFVTATGSASRAAGQQAQLADAASANAKQAQTAGASVSLDEESVTLVAAQHAYQAAARVLTAIDQALDTLINRTGTVGL